MGSRPQRKSDEVNAEKEGRRTHRQDVVDRCRGAASVAGVDECDDADAKPGQGPGQRK